MRSMKEQIRSPGIAAVSVMRAYPLQEGAEVWGKGAREVKVQVRTTGSRKVIDCGQDSILEPLFGDDTDVTQHGAAHLREEAIDEIEPGAVLRGEDESEAPFGLGGGPGNGFLGNLGRVIVEGA
jgi:hypothetical protein